MSEKKEEKTEQQKRIYQKEYSPQRKLLLWGWDKENNPSFLIFYGIHEFEQNSNRLEETLTYTDYMIFRGKEGHFPSFEAVKVIQEYGEKNKSLYYKKDIENRGYWYDTNEEEKIEEFVNLKKKDFLTIPYFEKIEYAGYVERVKEKRLKFYDFELAEHPNEVLNLLPELFIYSDLFCTLFGHQNIYMRKKALKELIRLNPPKSFYQYLLDCGSSELISGLFLELGQQKNPILLEAAEKLLESQITWVNESYAKGIKRCVFLYICCFREELKQERIKWIRETLPEIDLQFLTLGNRELGSRDYQKYFGYGGYFYEDGEYHYGRILNQFAKSNYCDGSNLDGNLLKNTIQEAERYDLPDVIGKIAYYSDAPRLTYYFKGNKFWKELLYFRRYVRRVMDGYAKENEEHFMQAMKALFTSYTREDYLCKFKENFQFNYFIKHYLYFDFREEIPMGWYERFEWMRNDQLKCLEGRYEFMPEVWERHLDDVIDIVCQSEVEVIVKALYFILKDTLEKEKEIEYSKLIQLSTAKYEPLSRLFLERLSNQLSKETRFDIDLMFSFFPYSNEKIHKIALDYWNKMGGKMDSAHLTAFLFSSYFEEWEDLFLQILESLEEEETYVLIQTLFRHDDHAFAFSDEIKNAFFKLAEKIQTQKYQKDMVSLVLSAFCEKQNLTDFMMEFGERILFSVPYAVLKEILYTIEIKDSVLSSTNKIKMALCFLASVKENKIPSDSQIIEILEGGTPNLIRSFLQNIKENKIQLHTRFSTLLLLLESDVEAMNEIGKQVFESLPKEEQKRLHLMILDSPVEKVTSYGMEKLYDLYEKKQQGIPKEFLLQMLEHPSPKVKAYLSNRIIDTIRHLGKGNEELFLYYAKTLLYLPNKVAKAKKEIYKMLPAFVKQYRQKQEEVEQLLFDLGGSNIISDSEKALVTLAELIKEVVSFEG